MSSHARDSAYQFSSARKLKNSRAAPRQKLGIKGGRRSRRGNAQRRSVAARFRTPRSARCTIKACRYQPFGTP